MKQQNLDETTLMKVSAISQGKVDRGEQEAALTPRLVAPLRILLGAAYVAGGLVPFAHWGDLPMPNPEAGQFMGALVDSRILVLSKLMEIVFGLALILGQWIPLALAALGPVLVFIVWVDFLLDPFPAGVAAVSAIIVTHLYLVRVYWRYYRALFERRATP